ncbi:MAG TPA: hypothetical protein DEB39_17080 [Planctomycetaceae bacterium]|nr:hypothetical protein [Planctomycetaceae bacterium]
MTRRILFIVFLFLCATSSPAQSLDELYGDIGLFGNSGVGAATQSRIDIAVSYQAPYLVLRATIDPEWHLYAFSQQAGATIPARLTLDGEETVFDGPIRPTSTPTVEEYEYYDVPLESFSGDVVWLIPIKSAENPSAPVTVPITGSLTGQICKSGPGGVCLPPFTIPWTAQEEDDDPAPLLAAAEKVPREFWFDPVAPPAPPSNAAALAATDSTVTDSAAPAVPDSGQLAVKQKNTGDYSRFLDGLEPRESEKIGGLSTALLCALLGGLILNVMPCVLPVIGLKILSFFEQAGQSRRRAFALNLVYSLGLLSVFLALAAMSVGLSKLFTFSLFNILMCVVVFAMALSLMDIWELSAPAFLGRGKSVELMQREGFTGAYFKGIITTLLAIPCGAPMLSPAIGWADAQIRAGQTPQVFLLYATIGLGMAFPYLLIGAVPELLRFLPKPGEWMDSFKKTMGFCLLIAVVWILYFIELARIVPMIAVLFAVWFACWTIGRLRYGTIPVSKRFFAWVRAIAVLATAAFFSFEIPGVSNPCTLERAMRNRLNDWAGVGNREHWAFYTHGRLVENLLDRKKTVLVDFTADWCVNCKVLEATVLESQTVLSEIDRRGLVSLQANITRSEEAKALLNTLGPESVPALAIFTPDKPNEPLIVRGNYTAKMLIDRL